MTWLFFLIYSYVTLQIELTQLFSSWRYGSEPEIK